MLTNIPSGSTQRALRAMFEADMVASGYKENLEKQENGEYKFIATCSAFRGWLAARNAILRRAPAAESIVRAKYGRLYRILPDSTLQSGIKIPVPALEVVDLIMDTVV